MITTSRVKNWIAHSEEAVLGIVLLIMAALVLMQVTSRYLLHQSLSYTEELVRYLFVWSVFLGISAGVRRQEHLQVRFVLDRLPPVTRRVFETVTWLMMAGFFALVGRHGWDVVQLQATTGQTTAALGMPAWWLGASVPVGSALVILRCMERTVKLWLRERDA